MGLLWIVDVGHRFERAEVFCREELPGQPDEVFVGEVEVCCEVSPRVLEV